MGLLAKTKHRVKTTKITGKEKYHQLFMVTTQEHSVITWRSGIFKITQRQAAAANPGSRADSAAGYSSRLSTRAVEV